MKAIFLVFFAAALSVGAAQLTDEQIIACTILGEARGESEAGMYAVAAVIKQRSTERRISPAAVCLQRLQFSCNNGGVQVSLLKCKQVAYAITLAKHIKTLDTSFINNANHYHTASVRPYWSKGKQPVAKIGNHFFFKL